MKAFAALTLAALAAMLGLQYAGHGTLAGVAKMTASCGFIGVAIMGGAIRSPYGFGILIGLCFSWWGDLFLIFRGDLLFLAGLIAFFLGHVSYCVAFYLHGIRAAWKFAALAALLPPAAAIAYWLHPNLPRDMIVPVYAYMVVITLMVALAAGAVGKGGTRLMLAGAVMFYVSDIFVARGQFVTKDIYNGLVGLPLYFGGQLLLAASVARVTQYVPRSLGPIDPPAEAPQDPSPAPGNGPRD